jgi:pimeloyl-ACP methyl ester carboxylesterase
MIRKTSKRKLKKRYIIYVLFVSYIIVCQSCMTMRMNPKETKLFFETSKTKCIDKKVTFQDHQIHYIETGNNQNPTLFFVHGSPGSWDAYKNYLKDTLLLKRYRMIAIDRPGFGYSNYRKAQNLKTQAVWISEFLKSIDNKSPIVLIGHSMGGPVIVKMAVDNPKLYSHLVILAGAVDPKAEKPEKWRKVIKSIPLRWLIPGALQPANDELWWLKQDLIAMQPELYKITSQVTIIHGTIDPLVPYSNMAFMQKEFINAKSIDTISIKKANHFIPWEHYDKIRKVLLELKI